MRFGGCRKKGGFRASRPREKRGGEKRTIIRKLLSLALKERRKASKGKRKGERKGGGGHQ